MPDRRAAHVLALGLTLLGGASCRTIPSPEAEALAVIEAQQAAWNRGDVEEFVELGYWRSPDLTFFSGGTITRGYEPLVERYRRNYVESAEGMGRLAFTELEAFALAEDSAAVRGRWRLEHDGAAPVGGLFTVLLRRIDGAWRIVHDHTSVDEQVD